MSLRLFAGLAIPDAVADRLQALQRGLPGAKWRPRENLHLTLCFFGDVQETTARDLDCELEAAALAAPAFPMRLKGAGWFGGAEPHAVWIGVEENAALRALAASCLRAGRKVGLAPDARKFAPHVTLAYVSRAPLDRVQAFETRCALFQSIEWRVERFFLYSSLTRRDAPSLYTIEAEYPLAP